LDAPIAIISMAQQASPKSAGQIELAWAQVPICFTVVVRIPPAWVGK
jgi:hypothetical protein